MKQQCHVAMIWLTWIGLPVLALAIGWRRGWAAGLAILGVGALAQVVYVQWFPHRAHLYRRNVAGRSGHLYGQASSKRRAMRMMVVATCLMALVPLGAVMSGHAQDKPDFSGEWILNREVSTLSPGADGVRNGTWRIEHREPIFRHKAVFVTAANPIEYEYQLRSDGPDLAPDAEGGSIRWHGDDLVVTFRTRRPEGDVLVSFRYELLDGGRQLRATEHVRRTDHEQNNVWIFDRR